jgi:PIN domain nuclease of toxin-antitoxin system
VGLSEVILLDTHVILWLSKFPERLTQAATEAIVEARTSSGIGIAAVSLVEIAQLATRKRVELDRPLDTYLHEIGSRFVVKHITVPVAIASTQFADPYPRDPIDRLIGATALVEGISLVTADERIRASGQVRTIW